jgi:hypothetical protein
MLALNSSERWRVERAWSSSFVCEGYFFCGVSLTVLQSRFIILRFTISLLKHISSEDFGSKSLILTASIIVPCIFRL